MVKHSTVMKFLGSLIGLCLISVAASAYLSPLSTSFSGQGLFANGTVSAPSASFINSPNAGLYRIGADDIGLSVAGILGLEAKKATGSYVNFGIGGAASTSNAFLALFERTLSGLVLNIQASNPSSDAQSGSQFEVSTDSGGSVCDFGIRSVNSVAPDAYAGGAGIFRCSGGSIPTVNLVADDIATATVKLYAGGNDVAHKIVSVSSSGLGLTTTGTKAACAAGYRGTMYFTQGGAGVSDQLEMCMKKADDTYAWVVVKAAP